MRKTQVAFVAVWVAALSLSLTACQAQKEAAQTPAQSPPSETDIKASIQRYIEQDRALKGAFLLKDPRSDQPLVLSFDHVHEAVHKSEEGVYSACVDFKDAAGKVYDVDVYVKSTQANPERLVLHKVDGKAISP